MKTQVLPIVIAAIFAHVLNNGLYAQQNKTNDHLIINIIYFDYDRPDLTLQAICSLDKTINTLKNHPIYTIEVYGHADSDGTLPYNFELSKCRTRLVAQYLISNGIDETNISTTYFGETKPIATNHTDEGKAINRRVEVVIKYEVENKEPVIYTSCDNIFYINNDKDAILLGEKGTRITIPANSLIAANGNEVTDSVKIELKEVFTKKDMILTGLTTISDGELLESYGMFYLNATKNGQDLKIKEGLLLEVEMPINTIKANIHLYAEFGSEKCEHPDTTPVGQFYTVFEYSRTLDENSSKCYRYLFEDPVSKMLLFSGEFDPNGNINWVPLGNKLRRDNKNNYDFISVGVGSLGWFNVDVFLFIPIKNNGYKLMATINKKLPNSSIYLVFKDKNSIIPVYSIKNGKAKFIRLERKDEVTLVALDYIEGIPHLAMKDYIIKRKLFFPFRRNKIKNFEFKQMTSEELDQALASL